MPILSDQYIRRLDVAVDHACRVDVAQGVREVLIPAEQFLLRNLPPRMERGERLRFAIRAS